MEKKHEKNRNKLMEIFDCYRDKYIKEFLEEMPIGTIVTLEALDDCAEKYFEGSLYDYSLEGLFETTHEGKIVGSWTYYENEALLDGVVNSYVSQLKGDCTENYETARMEIIENNNGIEIEFLLLNKGENEDDSFKWKVQLTGVNKL